MKIVFTGEGIHGYAVDAQDAVGGSERQQWYLAKALSACGWDVVVGVRDILKPGERCLIDGVKFVGLRPGHVLQAWRRLLVQERADWWYWRSASHLYGPSVAMARLVGVRTVFAVAFDRDVHPRRALSWRHRWWMLYACGLSWTDRVLVQHSQQLSNLPGRWRSKASIVPSIVCVPSMVTPHEEREPYVAWIGMLRQPKRPDVLVEIGRRLPRVRFVVCGGVSMHRTPSGYGDQIVAGLRALPNVAFLGQVSPQRAQDILARAAVLLCTSDEEGFPNTFLEAWSHGTPVASVAVDPDRVIDRFGLGLVSRDVSRLVRELQGLVDDTSRREEIATRARHYTGQHHDAAVVVRAFERAIAGPVSAEIGKHAHEDPGPSL